MNRCGGAANSPDDIDALFEQAYQNMQGDQSYQADVSLSQFLSPEPPPVPRQQRPTRTNQFFNQQTGAQCNFVTPRPPRTPPQFSPNMSYGNVTQSTMNYSGNESMMSGFQPLPVTPEQCPMPPPKGAAASRKPGPAAPPPKAPRPGNTPESPLDWGPNADLALEEVCRIFGMTPKDFEVKPTKSQRVKKFLKKMTPACLTPMRAAPESPQSEDDEIYEFHDYEVSVSFLLMRHNEINLE
ncbi:uncharacterized protein LOC109600067 [Aethina tumida]|uniref:uncharacterized protein LOC109600067 n=1 Tax=Aethina tumida TaxID=116153 RepID=UPI002148D7C4|nr:uncharacterized protein LOC109600067 [Aethina tumida]